MYVWGPRLLIKCLIWCLICSLDNVAVFSMRSICLIPVSFMSALDVNEEHLGMRQYWFGYKLFDCRLISWLVSSFLCPITKYVLLACFKENTSVHSIFRIGTYSQFGLMLIWNKWLSAEPWPYLLISSSCLIFSVLLSARGFYDVKVCYILVY